MEVKGSDIILRLDEILKIKNLKRMAVSEAVGISVQSFTDWKKRGSIPAADTAIKIADFLGVSVEWLITGHDPEGLSSGDRQLLADYHLISDEGKSAVRTLLDAYVKQAAAGKNEGVV